MEMANKSAQSGGNCSASNCDVVVWRGGGGGGRRRGLTKGEQEEEEKEEEERGGAGGDLTVKCGFCSSADCDQNGLFKMTTIDGSSSSSSCLLLVAAFSSVVVRRWMWKKMGEAACPILGYNFGGADGGCCAGSCVVALPSGNFC